MHTLYGLPIKMGCNNMTCVLRVATVFGHCQLLTASVKIAEIFVMVGKLQKCSFAATTNISVEI